MSLTGVLNNETGAAARAKINLAIDQVNTNVTNIATNTSDITNRQVKNAVSTLLWNIETGVTGDHVALSTDNWRYFTIQNAGNMTFTFPAGLAILTGAVIKISNHESSGGNIVLTPGGGVSIRPATLLTIAPGETQTIIKLGANAFRTFVG